MKLSCCGNLCLIRNAVRIIAVLIVPGAGVQNNLNLRTLLINSALDLQSPSKNTPPALYSAASILYGTPSRIQLILPLLTLLQERYACILSLEATLLKIPHQLLIARPPPPPALFLLGERDSTPPPPLPASPPPSPPAKVLCAPDLGWW